MEPLTDRSSLSRFAWLSIGAALLTMGLKGLAWWITGSVGLLSDALESLVNLAAAMMALGVLLVSARPPDSDHEYGHEKAEFFACGAEGVLIAVAAVSIAVPAWQRLLAPRPVEEVGPGLAVAVLASLVNLGVARTLKAAGRRHASAALEADAEHLMTDVWTSVGVVLGVGLVAATGWLVLDPLIALGVAAQILVSGFSLVRRSILGLMDPALPPEERAVVEAVLERVLPPETCHHALFTRQAGPRRYVSVHVLVPGDWSVHRGHLLLELVEQEVRKALAGAVVFTHLEPLEDPRSFDDMELFRGLPARAPGDRAAPGGGRTPAP